MKTNQLIIKNSESFLELLQTIYKHPREKNHWDDMLSDAEVITIMILFHICGSKCLKHFYMHKVYEHAQDLFQNTTFSPPTGLSN